MVPILSDISQRRPCPMSNLSKNTMLRLILSVVIWSFSVTACRVDDTSAVAVTFSPSVSTIPANALRLYVNFSEPMARGQASEYIYLESKEGTKLVNPFLNLNTELWNAEQTRLTLLFDPGRVKLGVGPNERYGAPLVEGREYSLVVNPEIKTARGMELGAEQSMLFKAGPAERTAFTPKNWRVSVPPSQSLTSVTIEFDRLMDAGVVLSQLAIKDKSGRQINGNAISGGKSWSFTPSEPWQGQPYEIVVPPSLEDIAGNASHNAFDSERGAMEQIKQPVLLKIRPL